MRKVLWGTTIFCIFLFTLVGLFVQFSPALFSYSLEKLLKTKVSIEKTHFSPRIISVDNLAIENPSGYKIKNAFSAKEILFKAPFFHYILPKVEIDEIELNDVFVSIIFTNSDNTRGNWFDIFSNIDSPSTGKKSSSSNRSVLIKKLILNNVQVELVRYGKDPLTLKPIKQIVLKDISSETGLPMKQITKIIVRQVIKSISLLSGIKDMLESFVSVPADVAQFVFKPFSFLFGGGNKKGEEKDQTSSPSPLQGKQQRSKN